MSRILSIALVLVAGAAFSGVVSAQEPTTAQKAAAAPAKHKKHKKHHKHHHHHNAGTTAH